MNYIYRGNAYWAEGDAKNAIADFDKTLRLDPKSAKAHIGRSRVFQSVGKWEMAFRELSIAAKIGSLATAQRALWESAFLHRELNHYDIALQQYNMVLQTPIADKSQKAFVFFQRGECHLRMGKPEESLKDLNEAMKLDPDLLETRRIRARTYTKLNRLPEAVNDYTTVIAEENRRYPPKYLGGMATHVRDLYRERANVYKMLGKKDLEKRDLNLSLEYDKNMMDSIPFMSK